MSTESLPFGGEESKAHKHLLSIVVKRPEDYAPWGADERDADWAADCSCGCRWYMPIESLLGMDWGVCTNKTSHRAGLLTFEHQGCRHGEYDRSWKEQA